MVEPMQMEDMLGRLEALVEEAEGVLGRIQKKEGYQRMIKVARFAAVEELMDRLDADMVEVAAIAEVDPDDVEKVLIAIRYLAEGGSGRDYLGQQ